MVAQLGTVFHVAAYHLGHMRGLVQLGIGLIAGNFCAVAVVCPQRFALARGVVANDAVGRVQNVGGRAVVLLQPDDPGAAEVLFKIQNILDGGAAEAVDALVVVAHHAHVLFGARQKAHQLELGHAGVLIFVHQHIAKAALVIFPHVCVLAQQPHRLVNQAVKIQRAGALQPRLVGRIHLCHQVVARGGRALGRHIGAYHAVFQAANGVQRRFHGQKFVVHLQRAVHFLHGALGVVGVVDGKAFGNAHMLAIAAQNAHAGRMEGRGVHVLPGLPQHGGKPVFQFARGLVGKGDGQNAVRPDGLLRQQGRQRLAGRAARLHKLFQLGHMRAGKPRGHRRRMVCAAKAHQVGNAVYQHGGFAAARARQNQQRPLGVKHRLALHIVQLAKLPLNILFSQRQKARGKFLFHESPAFFVLCAGPCPAQAKIL